MRLRSAAAVPLKPPMGRPLMLWNEKLAWMPHFTG